MNEKASARAQDKHKEIAFFDDYAAMDSYDVFTPQTTLRLVETCVRLARLMPGARVADLGCGSGVFTDLLHQQGFKSVGLDLSSKLVALGRAKYPAFDPNRLNPFMYLYRDRSSPFYSSVGVTENERPVLAHQIAAVFREAGFKVDTDYISDLNYRYLASSKLRWLLPAYKAIDRILFAPGFMRPLRAFVLTYGAKP